VPVDASLVVPEQLHRHHRLTSGDELGKVACAEIGAAVDLCEGDAQGAKDLTRLPALLAPFLGEIALGSTVVEAALGQLVAGAPIGAPVAKDQHVPAAL